MEAITGTKRFSLFRKSSFRRFFLTEKPRIGKFPLSLKISFRKYEWYIFPQGWSHIHTAKDDVLGRFEYQHKYNFSWLFIDLEWTQRLKNIGI